MRTFHIQTLGCRTNGADSDRIARLLTRRGLLPVADPADADLRIVNTCSVTSAAAAQSRQAARKAVSLPLVRSSPQPLSDPAAPTRRARVLVMGCWATSDPQEASGLGGVDAVLTHRDPVETRLLQLLDTWGVAYPRLALPVCGQESSPGLPADDATAAPGSTPARHNAPRRPPPTSCASVPLPQRTRQRAYLKVQDGCDAHCTYCIIPKLRPTLWSIDPADAVAEVRRLVRDGHAEVVLTGVFLGATGHHTALRRRQHRPGGTHLAELIRRIGREVPELPRLRLSSIEPGDLTPDLLDALTTSAQVVPHFHLPLQSGSDYILGRMNRQYRRDDYLALVQTLNERFDRPALTTDIVVGFPGENDNDFEQTLSVVELARFLHVHAFPFSPRPGTAAARWTERFVPGDVVRHRMARLRQQAQHASWSYRRLMLGKTVGIIIEAGRSAAGHLHGRCERYFDVELPGVEGPVAGECVAVRVTEVLPDSTLGVLVGDDRKPGHVGGRRLARTARESAGSRPEPLTEPVVVGARQGTT